VVSLKKNMIFALFISLILISGCTGKKSAEKSLEEIRAGTEGITMSFLLNSPPDKIHVDKAAADESSNGFEVALELRNKGAFPQPGEGDAPRGKVYLSGYDPEIIKFEGSNVKTELGNALQGKSTINPNGGFDVFTFKGSVNAESLNVEKYEPTLLASACYTYQTVAGPSVCIDPDPYSVTNERKVCQVQDTSLSSQGAPVAVTKINEEAFAGKTQFKITIKNVGNGEVLKNDIVESKCGPSVEKIVREDIDRVQLVSVKVGNNPLDCGPFANTGGALRGETGDIRLINGEGYIICELPSSMYSGAEGTSKSRTAYITPMTITLQYGYRNSIEKKVQILKEVSG